jgi:hypothetical protein
MQVKFLGDSATDDDTRVVESVASQGNEWIAPCRSPRRRHNRDQTRTPKIRFPKGELLKNRQLALGGLRFSSGEIAAIDALDTGVRGGPDPDKITLETFKREIPEA